MSDEAAAERETDDQGDSTERSALDPVCPGHPRTGSAPRKGTALSVLWWVETESGDRR